MDCPINFIEGKSSASVKMQDAIPLDGATDFLPAKTRIREIYHTVSSTVLRNAARTYIVRSPFVCNTDSRGRGIFLKGKHSAGKMPVLYGGGKRGPAMLTKKQSELLRFIHERLKETGVPPSFDEMKDALDLPLEVGHSPAHYRARRTRLYPPSAQSRQSPRSVALAESSTPAEGNRSKRSAPSVIEGTLGRVRTLPPSAPEEEFDRANDLDPGDRPDRGGHPDHGAANRQPHDQPAARHVAAKRPLRARSPRRIP